ncbi:MAG: hypothetical protein U1A27_09315 [Phycisphaerae bacterium]
MGLFDWLTQHQKPLSAMDRSELRKQELLLEKERDRLLSRVGELAKKKQDIFDRGLKEKTPEVRKALAGQFELHTTEQLLLARQLNIRSKEALTVSRLRMLRENAERARATGGRLGLVSERDLVALEKLIASDAVTAEMYQERLDAMLAGAGEEPVGELSPGGRTVLDIWEKMDTGLIRDQTEGFDEADRRVREQHRAAAEGG